ncbi:MAG: hypothetical protein P8X88_03570 [Gammaproteobacteria bacterium]
MYKLILMLFIAALMFGCSKEEAGEMMDKAGDMAEESMDKAAEMADDAGDAAKEMMDGDAKGPKLEPLPDWDSLPPIEEEMAEGGETMMEKAEDMAEDKAEEMMKKE